MILSTIRISSSTYHYSTPLTKDGEYGKAIHDLRRVCRNDAGTGPTGAVTRAMNAFEAVINASKADQQSLLSGLYDQESSLKDTDVDGIEDFITSLSPTVSDVTTDDVLRPW